MNMFFGRLRSRLRWRSISTKITLVTLLACLIGGALLAFVSIRFLAIKLEKELGSQQLSSAALIAAQVDNQLNILVNDLEQVSPKIGDIGSELPVVIQSNLDKHSDLLSIFSAGVFVVNTDRQVLASLQKDSQKRLPVEVLQRIPSVWTSTLENVFEPFVDAQSGMMMSAIFIPMHSADGRVLGVLVGLNLSPACWSN